MVRAECVACWRRQLISQDACQYKAVAHGAITWYTIEQWCEQGRVQHQAVA
jgi:hypothetical protein